MKKHLLSLTLFAVLSACSSGPTSVVVSPVMLNTSSVNYMQKQANLKVVDARTSSHVVQILKESKAATLYSSQTAISDVITQTLTQAYKKQGLTLSGLSNNTIEVFIDKALVSVDQSLMKYTAKNEIALRLVISNGNDTLTKNYKTSGKSDGALTADLAVLERDLNQQLGNLLEKVIADQSIQQLLK